jgi:hypothetical protein
MLTPLELMPWVQKGDPAFYNRKLAGMDLGISTNIYWIRVPSNSENAKTVRLSQYDIRVLRAIGNALGGKKWRLRKVRRTAQGYSVRVSGSHRVLADLLRVGNGRAGTIAAEIKASLGIEFHCYAPDGTQWLA